LRSRKFRRSPLPIGRPNEKLKPGCHIAKRDRDRGLAFFYGLMRFVKSKAIGKAARIHRPDFNDDKSFSFFV
jgi:hypothetical protein